MSEVDTVVDGEAQEIIPEIRSEEEEEQLRQLPEFAASQAVVVRERENATPPANVLPSPAEWEATMVMARTIADTTFVPKAYRGKPEAVVAGILYGREIGLGPMVALQKVHIIDGKPSLAAEEMMAQMRRGGIVILDSESTGERAMIHARRKDTGEEATVEWTIQDAIDAGLTSKDNWTRYRVDMLWARCVGRLCRRLGSDLVGGMVYAAEEMQDWDDYGGYGGSGYDTPIAETPVGQLKDWRDPRFDPALSLAQDAPAGWGQIQKLGTELDAHLADWIASAIVAFYGTPARDMDSVRRAEAGKRVANALARIRDELFAKGDFPPPSDDEYLPIFSWAFGGIALEVPEGPFDGEPEEAADAEATLAIAEEPTEPTFDPRSMLRDDAPSKKSGWKGINEILLEIDPSLNWGDVIKQAIIHVYGVGTNELEGETKAEAWHRTANAAGRLSQLFVEEKTLTLQSVQQAFAEMFMGIVVRVPELEEEAEEKTT